MIKTIVCPCLPQRILMYSSREQSSSGLGIECTVSAFSSSLCHSCINSSMSGFWWVDIIVTESGRAVVSCKCLMFSIQVSISCAVPLERTTVSRSDESFDESISFETAFSFSWSSAASLWFMLGSSSTAKPSLFSIVLSGYGI